MPEPGICDHGYYVEECPICNYEPDQPIDHGDDERAYGYDGDLW